MRELKVQRPLPGCNPSCALQVFGPAFKRNSRWSVTQPVPDVGDEQTPYDKVDKFYDFWFSFKSWREFPHADEEDVEQAESREEKRCRNLLNAAWKQSFLLTNFACILICIQKYHFRVASADRFAGWCHPSAHIIECMSSLETFLPLSCFVLSHFK